MFKIKFGSVNFYKKALSIAIPVMAQLFIQNLVSLIDNFMVAGLGDIKMSGVNIAGQVNFIFLVLIGNVLCNGGGIFMSQFRGANDKKGMQQVFRYKLIICLFFATLYTVICRFCPVPILKLMVHGNAQSGDIVLQASMYQQIIAWTWIPMVITAAISSSLRETGEVRVPLIISVIATLINTFGNYVLIYGHFGAPRLEVTGAAIATVIARVIEMLTFVVYIYVKKPDFYSKLKDIFKVKITLAGNILSKTGMIAISELTWVLSETVSTALYNSRGGADVVSGMAAGFTIANLFFVSFSGIFTATGVIIGTTLGAGKLDEAKKQKNWILNGSFIFGIFFGVIGVLSTFLIPVVFSNLSSNARFIARGLVFAAAAYMPIWCYCNGQFAISRTGGDTMMGVIVDLTANFILFLPGMFIMTYFTNWSPVLMYAIVKVSDIEKVIVASIWLKKEKWLKNLATENAISTKE